MADYYASATGSGGNGTKANPWGVSEINWSTLASADHTLFLCGGTYTGMLQITHATTDYRLTIRPGSASPDPSGIDGLVLFDRAEPASPASPGTTIYATGNNTTLDGRTSDSVSTINWKLSLGNNHGVAVSSAGRTGNIIRYLEICDMLDETADPGNGSAQVYAIDAQLQLGLEIDHCYLHDNWGMADIVVSGAASLTGYGAIKVHHNRFERGTVNFISGNGHSVRIYDNDMDMSETLYVYDTIHVLGNGISYLEIFNNRFVNLTPGVAHDQVIFLENSSLTGAKTEHLRIYGNLFHNLSGDATHSPLGVALENADSAGGVDDVFICANTFVSNGTLIAVRMYGNAGSVYSNVLIEGNIFSGCRYATTVESVTWSSDADVVFDYNLTYSGGTNQWQLRAASGGAITTYTSFSGTWATHHPTFSHNVAANPVFVSASDFSLDATSPAAGSGKDLSAYADMDASTDIAGSTRGAVWSMGAYQYTGTLPETPETPGANPSGRSYGARVLAAMI